MRNTRGVLVALLLVAATSSTTASAASAAPRDSSRTLQVQQMLDRIIGPGNSVVRVAATLRASSGVTTTVAWGNALPEHVVHSHIEDHLGTRSSSTRINAVDRTVATEVHAHGTLVRQTVAVAVDRASAAGVPEERLRRLIVSAVGLDAARGDRLVVVRTAMARPAAPAAVQTTPWDRVTPLAVPAMQIAGVLVALLIGARAILRPARIDS